MLFRTFTHFAKRQTSQLVRIGDERETIHSNQGTESITPMSTPANTGTANPAATNAPAKTSKQKTLNLKILARRFTMQTESVDFVLYDLSKTVDNQDAVFELDVDEALLNTGKLRDLRILIEIQEDEEIKS